MFQHHAHALMLTAFLAAGAIGCLSAHAGIEHKPFGTTASGKNVDLYTLTNEKGAVAEITNYGGLLVRLQMPDKAGKLGDVVLGFDNLQQYEKDSPYFGALIGRVGNRIAKGTFMLDGQTYHVPVNNGPNSLHGGKVGYDKRVWDAEEVKAKDGQSLRLTLVDADGDQGYPGTVKATVTYTLTVDNAVRIEYSATTDKATPIMLTNHSYFNLKDGGKTTIDDTVLQLKIKGYLPVDSTLIPTGKVDPVAGTPIDFTQPKPIGQDLVKMGGDPVGYDHCVVLDNSDGSFAFAAKAYEPTTGRVMEMWTTEPAVQFYSGNFLDGTLKGRDGATYPQHSAFALEAEHYPDSINHPSFPNTVLKPGETYHQKTEYRFSTSDKAPW